MGKHSDAARGRQPKALLLVTLYALAETKIGSIIQRTVGRVANIRDLRSRRLEVVAEVHKLERQTPELVRAVVSNAWGVGNGSAEQRIGSRGRRPLSAIDTKASSILADNLISDLGSAARTIGRMAEDVLRREGLRASLRQLEQDTPEGIASDEMARRLEREGVTGFVDKAGRRWKLSTYCEMAVRTTSAEALAEGTKAKMLERGFDLVDVSDHDCNHHPKDPQHDCRRLEGKTLSITGLTQGYEKAPRFPLHPNCTHFLLPSPQAFEVPPLGDAPEFALA